MVITETRPLHPNVGAILVPGLLASFVGLVLQFKFSFCPNLPLLEEEQLVARLAEGNTLWTSLVAQW